LKSEKVTFDSNTLPKCKLEEKKFEWGEPYTIMTPIFELDIKETESELEYFIDVYGKNNFKTQLLRLYNKINNYEEAKGIINFQYEELTQEKRVTLKNKINEYLEINKDKISPWELYEPHNYTEFDYIEKLTKDINKEIYYVEKE
jgi:hypothetical protein